MSTPYWIHCNICAALMASNKTSFYMLSCSHMLCKECMHQTDRGTKCPLCKSAIKYMDFNKFTKEQKEKFQPNASKEFKKTLNKVKFQYAQQSNLAKLTQQQKMKVKKAAQYHAQLKENIMKKKQMLNKLMEQRRLMQQRLKEIYLKNQKKKASQMYREQQPSFNSNHSTSSRISSNSKNSSTPSFFSNGRNPKSSMKVTPPLALYSTNFFEQPSGRSAGSSTGSGSSASFFGSKPQQRQPLKERSQAHRSPFFA